jgi:hypothetical protein
MLRHVRPHAGLDQMFYYLGNVINDPGPIISDHEDGPNVGQMSNSRECLIQGTRRRSGSHRQPTRPYSRASAGDDVAYQMAVAQQPLGRNESESQLWA